MKQFATPFGAIGTAIYFGLAAIFCSAIGCEQERGVRRTATLPSLPDFSCVARVLRSTADVRDVRESDSGDPHAPSTYRLHRYDYEGAGFRAHLSLVQQQGKILFIHERLAVSGLSPREASRTLQVMKRVEVRLVSECGLVALADGVVEEWKE